MKLSKQDKNRFDKLKFEEEHIDSVWGLIMYDYSEAKGEEYLKENEEVKNDSHYAPTPETTERFIKMINGFFRERKLQWLAAKSLKILNKAGIVFIVLTVAFALAFFTVEAFRVEVLNFLLTSEKEFTSVQLEKIEPGNNITANFRNAYMPSYIPAGYWLVNEIDMGDSKTIEYANDEGKFIRFSESNHTGIINIDTEDADIVKSIKINESEGIFVSKNDKVTVSWTYDNRIFVISAQISEKEIVQIAESVVFIN